jgi:hypothetical protein
MNDEDIKELNETLKETKIQRERDLLDALESSEENSRKVKACKKRLKQVDIKIEEGI